MAERAGAGGARSPGPRAAEATSVLRGALRRGAYHDSIVLMRLQVALAALPGILDAGAALAAPANLALLEASDLLPPQADGAGPGDLVVAVRAVDAAAAEAALARLDALLAPGAVAVEGEGAARIAGGGRSRRLSSAIAAFPGAGWAAVSTPGRFAAEVAQEALDLGLHVFLFSDNVPLESEVSLKEQAAARGLLVLGPDCGTGIVGGVGLGFANRVRRGGVGIVAASGTGLQAVASRLHALGGGISHALGIGGRDLSGAVGGRSGLAALDLLARDSRTRVIVVLAKASQSAADPEAARQVGRRLLAAARRCGKPVVVCLLGRAAPLRRIGDLWFASGLEDAAELAARLEFAAPAGRPIGEPAQRPSAEAGEAPSTSPAAPWLRGLFAGGTLAQETLAALDLFLAPLASNLAADAAGAEAGATGPIAPASLPGRLAAHTILDLGADELTQGRLHPLADPSLRLRWLHRAVDDPAVGVILLDLVLGDATHPDPAAELAPVIAAARSARPLAIGVIAVGTDEDPQGLAAQLGLLAGAGAAVFDGVAPAVDWALDLLLPAGEPLAQPVPLSALAAPPAVVSIGLEAFGASLLAQGARAIQLAWRPPAGGDQAALTVLRRLATPATDAANREAVERMMAVRPVLTGVAPARRAIPALAAGDLLLHAGPPIGWERASGPLRGALMGALLYEGRAGSEAEVEALLASGGVRLEPCHHHGAVGPMAGVVSPAMAVYVVEDREGRGRAVSTLNEGYGKVLRYGAFGPEVLERLRWINEVLAPLVGRALERMGGLDLRALVAEALHMGDEGHNRNKAGSLLFVRQLAPHIAAAAPDAETASRALAALGDNALAVLNPVMAACKLMAQAGHGVAGSTVVTAMARNGTDFGIRVSGLGDAWFTAPALVPEGLFFSGFGASDANPDIGDSTITETAGIGAFAMAAAPAIVSFVGGSPGDALEATLEMYDITVAEHRHFTIPALDFRGTPLGIDVRKVVELGLAPRVNTGIAHRDAGVGQIGAGLVRPPLAIFAAALRAF